LRYTVLNLNDILINDKYCYRIVKNFGGQKVWRKGLLEGIGEKNFGEC